jgi:predicted Zn-dependent peptidase
MRKEVLDNGFEIYTETIDVAKTVTFSIYVKAGSYYESEPFGVAHLLEHMVFKGTTNRSTQQISEDIERYGGYMNAETSFEHTRYFTTIPYENWEKGAEVICDISFNSTIPEKEFIMEKKVVQEELKMYSDDSSSHVSDMLLQSMFKSYPNRQTIGGTVESVGDITRENILNFRDLYYQPNNMFAVVSGNVSHEEVVDFLENMVPKPNNNGKRDMRKSKFNHDILNSQMVSKKRDIEQSHL